MEPDKMSLKEKLKLAETRISLPQLAEQLGLVVRDTPGSCRSPFREERNPSFSWWIADDSRARWKDFATGEGGDCPGFISKATGMSNRDAVLRYLELANLEGFTNTSELTPLKSYPCKPSQINEKPTMPSDLHPGSIAEITQLINLRGWEVPIEHLHEISLLQQLRFGTHLGEKSWLLSDPLGRFFEARRLDGKPWNNGAKSNSRGTKSLLGAESLSPGCVALLVEGAPDFLACSIYKSLGKKLNRVFADNAVPVAMLGAGMRLKTEDLNLFNGVRAIVIPHLDDSGQKACDTWKAQLRKAGAVVKDLNLSKFVSPGGKDLADTFNPYYCEDVIIRMEILASQLREEMK